jgi:hypothetical protein
MTEQSRLEQIRNRLANAKCGGHRMVKCEVYTADVTLLLAALDDAAQWRGWRIDYSRSKRGRKIRRDMADFIEQAQRAKEGRE